MKKIKVLVSVAILIIFSIVCLSLAADFKYVGSKNSNKYHNPDCKWAKKISPKNLVTFKTAEEALAAGYVPCKVCRPPTKD
jgi:methylphosphotriester-DNA--protein-cysteine methyltransferase